LIDDFASFAKRILRAKTQSTAKNAKGRSGERRQQGQAMIEFSEEAKRRYQTILSHYPEKRAALLPVLTLAQREFGWISQEVAEYIGGLMGYPPSDVLSVATF